MPRRRKSSDSSPFDTLRLEGGLFVAELLERAARGGAPGQDEADYGVPKGLKLHDEYGRAYRIATALWKDFAARMPREDAEPHRTTLHFVRDLFRDTLGYTDLDLPEAPVALGDRAYPIPAFSPGGRVPVVVAPHDLGLDEPDARFAIQGSGARRKSPHQLAQEFLNASPNSSPTSGAPPSSSKNLTPPTKPNLSYQIQHLKSPSLLKATSSTPRTNSSDNPHPPQPPKPPARNNKEQRTKNKERLGALQQPTSATSSKASPSPPTSKPKSKPSPANTASSTGTSPSPKFSTKAASPASSAIRRGNGSSYQKMSGLPQELLT
jgi:hypothetical protein